MSTLIPDDPLSMPFSIKEMYAYFFDSEYGVRQRALNKERDPDEGIFSSTAALEIAEQLHNLYTKTRNAYHILLARLGKSGFHAAHDELVKAAFERTGEGRIKDISLFFYYLTIRNTDLTFLDSNLQEDENGDEVAIEKEAITLSDYSKRKLAITEKV